MKSFVAGLILGLLLVFGGAYFYFASGSAPVATDAEAMPFEKKFAHMALNARVEKEMPKSVPFTADETAYLGGADVYHEHCAVCHGQPGQPATAIAKGMFPKPPVLLEGKGVTDDPAQETYWKVANGIRMTGMPAFKKTLTEQQMWQVSLLLANADKVPPSVKDRLASQPTPPLAAAPRP